MKLPIYSRVMELLSILEVPEQVIEAYTDYGVNIIIADSGGYSVDNDFDGNADKKDLTDEVKLKLEEVHKPDGNNIYYLMFMDAAQEELIYKIKPSFLPGQLTELGDDAFANEMEQ